MSGIRAAVFDMDGLLIDTEPIWRRVEIEICGRLGLHLTEEQCMETMGVRVGEVVQLWYNRHPWIGPTTDAVTGEIIDGVIKHVSAEGVPKPGVCNALEIIHGGDLPIAIASSSSEVLIRAVIRRLGIDRYITAVCSADDDSEGKPHPAVYLRAASRLGVHPSACLAFEDSPNGVVSAKAAGMVCIAVPDPYLADDPRMAVADFTLGSLEEFTPEMLAGLRAS